MVDYSTLPAMTLVTRTVWGNKRVHLWTCPLATNTWPAGGLSLTPATLGLSKINQLFVDPGVSGLLFSYDYTNKVLHAWTTGTAGAAYIFVEAEGSTPATSTISILAIGDGVA
jgi:hypothetical protein